MEHTFSICAYKESPYLEECIISLKRQSVKSDILMVTSTPSLFLEEMAEKYGIALYINEKGGITQDWNFAYKNARTELVTIAHQDDVYLPHYVEEIRKKIKRAQKPLIAFTDYAELRNGETVYKNRLLGVKRAMLFPLAFSFFQSSRMVRRRILSFGDPICCPAVTFVKNNLPAQIFREGFRSCEDWEAWERLSKRKGQFIYLKEVGMCHRIHRDSETSAILRDHGRGKENFIMFSKFWPYPIAKFLTDLYSASERSNEL